MIRATRTHTVVGRKPLWPRLSTSAAMDPELLDPDFDEDEVLRGIAQDVRDSAARPEQTTEKETH